MDLAKQIVELKRQQGAIIKQNECRGHIPRGMAPAYRAATIKRNKRLDKIIARIADLENDQVNDAWLNQ